jgi:hypothetical protein
VQGRILDQVRDSKIFYIAANGPDRRASFSGSGLPFANQEQAFAYTPNVGDTQLGPDGSFSIDLITPNSYMVALGSVTIPPSLFIQYFRPDGTARTVTIRVAEAIPYRTLTYPVDPRPRANSTFYDSQFIFPVTTQEQHFYDSAYPCNRKTHPNFWGLKYPN